MPSCRPAATRAALPKQVAEPAAPTAEDEAFGETVVDHPLQGEVEVGAVLVDRVALHGDTAGLGAGEPFGRYRVEVADQDVDVDAGRPGRVEPGVDGDDGALGGEPPQCRRGDPSPPAMSTARRRRGTRSRGGRSRRRQGVGRFHSLPPLV